MIRDYGSLSPNLIAKIVPRRGKGPTRNLRDLILPGSTYTDSGTERSTRLSLNLNNRNGQLFDDRDIVRKGTVIDFTYGYPGKPNRLYNAGQFVIDDHKGQGSVLTVICKPRARKKMARKKFSRRWDSTKRSTAVREVLSAHFPATAIHIDETDLEIDTINQTGEHDWQFCTRQGQLSRREFWPDARGIHWQKPRRNQEPSRLLRYVRNPIGIGEITSPPSFDGLGAGIPGRVVLKGRDIFTKKPFEVVASADTTDDLFDLTITANAETPDEGDRQDGGDTGNEIVRPTGACTMAEAQEIADTIFTTERYGALKMTLQTIGDPTMRSRTVTLVWGVGLAMDGLWWVQSVRHTFGRGYKQSLSLTREGLADRLKMRKKKKPLTLSEENALIRRTAGGILREFGM